MAISGLKLEGRVYGLKEIQQMYAAAPGAFFKAIRHRMYSERKRYVGTKGAHWLGKFRKQIMAKKRAGKGAMQRGGTWPKNVAAAFKGYLRGDQKINTMEMHLGTGLLKPSKFSRGLTMMDEAFSGSRTISGGGKNMPIPVYRNLLKAYSGMHMSRAFRDMSRENKLVAVRRGGKIYWFDKEISGKGAERGKFKKSALMFIGAKSVKISPQFSFMNYMAGEVPRIIVRARREIDGTVRRLRMGKTKKGDFLLTPGVNWE